MKKKRQNPLVFSSCGVATHLQISKFFEESETSLFPILTNKYKKNVIYSSRVKQMLLLQYLKALMKNKEYKLNKKSILVSKHEN